MQWTNNLRAVFALNSFTKQQHSAVLIHSVDFVSISGEERVETVQFAELQLDQ